MRRSLMSLALAIASIFLNIWPCFAGGIAVFIPEIESSVKANAILKADPALKDMEVFVFAKFKDFQAAIESKSFDFIITPEQVLNHQSGFKPIYQATLDGTDKFSYLLIALDKKWQKIDHKEATVAVVEMLDRKETKIFFGNIFDSDKFLRVKGIPKSEDIYPILAIGNADVAIVSPSMYAAIKDKFSEAPIELGKSTPVRRFMVAKHQSTSGSSIEFSKLGQETLGVLGATGLTRITGSL